MVNVCWPCPAYPDRYPWEKFPSYAVFRHPGSEKWFCLPVRVSRSKLGPSGEEEVEIIDVKARAERVGALRKRPGFLPAYHMNKEHWVTAVLDGSVHEDEIFEVIDDSFALTKQA
ncbi:MmcQ/YjbR family DNA-binding protein [Paraburkholderia sp. MM5384-R2]|uniref:MmcQ/YjbR family DNA-binding protein n=1 Tax=Paraburkholderia sp. MM5384-R2 TaxID=2723097 RepID=UPI00161F801B|nr:MmcQ/YjbR family DNA-binding protein [Paraburkholderia sp. MM5384-R2]MBB5497533.1 putative DNA-binding protein (MmcQ/YjbR family) [Paraburkholderia sp. MM5384-R2]